MNFAKTIFTAGLLALVAQTAAAFAPDIYEVCGLDPNGDNFLAFRAGPSSSAKMLYKLGPGTELQDSDGLGQKGKWLQVVVQDGNQWVHGWVWSDYLCVVEDH